MTNQRLTLSLLLACATCMSANAAHAANPFKPAAAVSAPADTAVVMPNMEAVPEIPEQRLEGEYIGSVNGKAIYRYEGRYFFETDTEVLTKGRRDALRSGAPKPSSAQGLPAVPPPIPSNMNPLPRQNKLP